MARKRPQPFRVFRVGGSVRDELLGRPDADRDFVVVGATPELMIASGYRPVGRDFPVFLHPETQEEYALARTERKHGRGYRGFEFFASPDVTLDEDLVRRDLTINAMARGDDGVLVDPFGGARDLNAGVLRHVSAAFAEDPLRVLRVARFAARFDFTIAPETEALMRAIVASGELSTLSPERIWQELAKGLAESHPSRLLAALRACGALAALLPEVDALYGVAQPPRHHAEVDTGVHVAMALDWGAAHGFGLATRYAILAHDLGKAITPPASWPRHHGHEGASVRLAERLSARLRVPQECADAARLTARWHGIVHRAAELRPATLLDLFGAVDAMRRPERLATVLDASAADACSRPGASQAYAPAALLNAALAVARDVPAGEIARHVIAKNAASGAGSKGRDPGDAVAKAVRSARLAALRKWRRDGAATPDQTR
jgi:tRNA nucleotidyltransferase (CCA-adding enzyme)